MKHFKFFWESFFSKYFEKCSHSKSEMKDEKGSKWFIKLCETIQRSFDVTHIGKMLKFQYKIVTVFPHRPINVKEVHSCFSQLRFLFQEHSTIFLVD